MVLDKNSPQVQTVVNKTDAISNEYRTMQLEVLAGNHSLVTTVVENGLRFLVDLATVYMILSDLIFSFFVVFLKKQGMRQFHLHGSGTYSHVIYASSM